MFGKLIFVLVDDEHTNQRHMINFLNELFPDNQVKVFETGEEAIEYLLSPASHYDLVILDGHLKPSSHKTKQIDGPDVAAALKKNRISVPVVLWTNDPNMLERFDEVYGERLAEMEKPCRKTNIEVILKPIVNSILLAK